MELLMELSKKQRQLLCMALYNGKVSVNDAMRIYTDNAHITSAFKRLEMGGFIKRSSVFGTFEFIGREEDVIACLKKGDI